MKSRKRKILTITNLYPPAYIGGYELLCADVVRGLSKRGYEIPVLTSNYRSPKSQEEGVFRELAFYEFWKGRRGKLITAWFEWREKCTLQRALEKFQPDLIYLWNMQGLAKSLIQTIEKQGVPAVFSIFGYWPLEMPSPERPKLKFALFCSNYVSGFYKQKLLIPEKQAVIYHGIDVPKFCRDPEYKTGKILRLLYVGQVVPHKGVHTIIKALSILIHQRGLEEITLTIVGPQVIQEYARQIKKIIGRERVDSYVFFRRQVPRDELISIYQNHDIFIFSSVYAEPWGLVILEAMSCGLPVIGASVGGSAEIFKDGINCLVFPPGDPVSLANQIEILRRDKNLRQRLGEEARKTVVENYTLERTLGQIEEFLEAVS